MMRRLLLLLILLSASAMAQTVGSFTDWCQAGGQVMVIQGLNSTTLAQGSYPNCTVTVFLSGTSTLATIYSTSTLTPLSPIFTANNDGSFTFYASIASLYDVTISSNTQQVSPNVGPTPSFTFRGVAVNSLGGGGGGGGSGTVTAINTGAGLTGGPITNSGTISIPSAGVTNSMLANSSITINTAAPLTGGGVVALGGTLNLGGGSGGVSSCAISKALGIYSVSGATIGCDTIFTDSGTQLLYGANGSSAAPAYGFSNTPDIGTYTGVSSTYSLNVTGASAAAGVATLTTTQTVRLTAGSSVLVSGVGGSNFNGTFLLTAVGANSVSYACASCSSAGAGGTVQPYHLGLGGFAVLFNRLRSTSASASPFGSIGLGPNDPITYGCLACSNTVVLGTGDSNQNLIRGNGSSGGADVGDYQGANLYGPLVFKNNQVYFVDTPKPTSAMLACVEGVTNSCQGVSNDGNFYIAPNGTNPVRIGTVLPGDVNNAGTVTAIQSTVVTGTSGSGKVIFDANPSFSGISADLGQDALTTQIPNNATGTTLNLLAKYAAGSPASVLTAAITDTNGFAGVCVAACGTTGNAKIARVGKALATFDGATTVGDWAVNSPTVAGDLHDSGIAPPSCPLNQQLIGRVATTNGGGGTYVVQLSGPDVVCSSTVTSTTVMAGWCTGTIGTANPQVYQLAPFIGTSSNLCNNTSVLSLLMPVACSASSLRANASAAGAVAGSGVVTLYKGTNPTALTCTLGTGTTCNDVVDKVSFNAADTYSLRVATGQATDTTANITASFICQ